MSNHHPIIYGKASDNTIQPLVVDSTGKLLTEELNSNDIKTKLDTLNTSTIANLPFNPNTPSTWTNSRLGTILTQQIDGTHITKTKITRTQANLLTTESLTSLELWGTNIDCSNSKSIRFLGVANEPFNIYGSIDDTNYYLIYTIIPSVNLNHLNHFNYMFSNPPKYIKIKNGSSANTITLDYSLVN
tara:strand:+ start:175 stop:735 length:561 start_codon:yes stop_codon:yes gene_type:complete